MIQGSCDNYRTCSKREIDVQSLQSYPVECMVGGQECGSHPKQTRSAASLSPDRLEVIPVDTDHEYYSADPCQSSLILYRAFLM